MCCILFYPTNEINIPKDNIFVFFDKYNHFIFTYFRGFGSAYFLRNDDKFVQFIAILSYTL